ncbi:MAG: 3-dehydroquinate synthase [Elusimicrobia bacterium]|nr:3-dehydroquinate synthase [Elusimicrobiota bacterium]
MLTIQSRSHPYTVEESASLDEALATASSGSESFVLADANLLRLYPRAFVPIAKERLLALTATEGQKSYEKLPPVFTRLLESGFRRDWTLVVAGGGVLQDIGCFVASILFRGAAWTLIPTTLLAQCDSCVGSKSSLNVGSYKNQLGTFYPPRRILIPFDVLKTLPPDAVRSGVGEMIKLALIAGPESYETLRARLRRLPGDPSVVREMVRDTLTLKKGYVEIDELDQGPRNILNYGHTFGHAYESATAYAIPHGIAVTLGVLTATHFSEKLGMSPPGSLATLDADLHAHYAPYERHILGADPETILKALSRDKKNAGGQVHCILTRGPGHMEKVPLDPVRQVRPLMLDFLSWLGGRH